MKGKCFIYKRATLYMPGQAPQLFDYTDGLHSYNCSVDKKGEYYVYKWNLPGKNIEIPLNVSRRMNNGSLVRKGVLPYQGGELHWEYLFGQFKSYPKYYMDKLLECLPLLIVVLVLLYLYNKKNY